jgi:hypothetical protein
MEHDQAQHRRQGHADRDAQAAIKVLAIEEFFYLNRIAHRLPDSIH